MKWLALPTALLVASCAGAGSSGRQSINADIGLSEWAPSGEVELDLRSGRYRLRPARPRTAPEGTVMPIRTGTLAPDELRLVREAFDAAWSEGLTEPVCADGGPPPTIVVGNMRTPVMVLRSQGRTLGPPAERGCWTASARRLHSTLQSTFRHRSQEPR